MAAAWAVMLAAIVMGFCSLRLMYVGYSPFRFGDDWTIALRLSRGARWYSWSWLWSMHNEHRPVLVRLTEVADLYFLGGGRICISD